MGSARAGGPQPEPPGDGPFGNQNPDDAQGPGLEPPTPTGAAGAGPASGGDTGAMNDAGLGVETPNDGAAPGTTLQQGDQGPVEGRASPADQGSPLTSSYRDGGVASDWDSVLDADAGVP